MLDVYEKNARLKWPQSLVAIYKMKYGNLTQPLTPLQRRLVKNIWQIHLLESINLSLGNFVQRATWKVTQDD